MSAGPWPGEALFPKTSAPQETLEVQALIAGVGPAALAAAEGLARNGLQVALIPPVSWAQAPVLEGAGAALPLPGPPWPALCRRLGRQEARRYWEVAAEGAADLRMRLIGAECDLERGGVLVLADEKGDSEEMVEGLADLVEAGIAARMMGPSAATGYLPVETGFPVMYLGGAASFHPARALAALAAQAAGIGVRFLAPCAGLCWTEGSKEVEVAGSGFLIRTGLLVLAEGAFAAEPGTGLVRDEAHLLWTGPLRQGVTRTTIAAAADQGREIYRSGPEGGLLAWISAESADPVERLRRRFPETRRVEILGHRRVPCVRGEDGLPLAGFAPGSRRIRILEGFGAQPWSLAWGAGQDLARSPGAQGWADPGRFR